jgi:hypothetical protein
LAATIFSIAACTATGSRSGAPNLAAPDQFAYLMIRDFLSTDQWPEMWISQDEERCVPVRSTTLAHMLENLSSDRGKIWVDCRDSASLLLSFSVSDDLISGWVGYQCEGLCGHSIGYTLRSEPSGPSVARRNEIYD